MVTGDVTVVVPLGVVIVIVDVLPAAVTVVGTVVVATEVVVVGR